MKYSVLCFLGTICCSMLLAQPNGFTPTGPGAGGYMYAPSISPFNHNQIYLVCDMAGVYRTDNGGESWNLFHYNQLVSLVKGKVQFTNDPNVLYTIRRIETPMDPPYFRAEPAKSVDGGNSWQSIPDPTSSGVHRLLADPNSTQRLLVSEYDRLFFSGNGGQTFTEVYHPADDQMWLGGAFWDGNNIYVGTGKGLLVSHNGGQSFALENHSGLPAGAGIFHLSGAKQGNTTRLFIVSAAGSDLYAWLEVLDLRNSLLGCYKMNYSANAQWTNVAGNLPPDAHVQWVDLALNNLNTVYIAGDINGLPQIYKSVDGGNTWNNTYLVADNENIRTGWAGDYGAFSYQWGGGSLGFDVADNDPNIVVTTDGYAHISTDGGAHWRQMYVSPGDANPEGVPTAHDKSYRSAGLNVTTGHHLLWLSPNEMFAGSTDIGNQYSQDGGVSWSFARNTFYPWGTVGSPNWYTILQRPDNQDLYAAVADLNDAYLGYRLRDDDIEWSGGLVLKSGDKGLHWDTLHDFGHAVVWLAMDPNNPQRLYASVVHHEEGGIYRSLDGGQQWSKLPAPPRTEGHPYNIRLLNDGSIVASYAARALSDGETLTPSSGIFYSPDGGDTWLDRSASSMQFYTKDLIISPHDLAQNTWYATVWGRFTNFPGPNNEGNGGLYRSFDRGQHWERIFTHERTESATFHPTLPDVLYLTVEFDGLHYCDNLSDAAPTFQRVEAFPYPRPKRVFFNPFSNKEVWVTTMGGALWKGNHAITPITEVHPVNDIPAWNVGPNPVSQDEIGITLSSPGDYLFTLYSSSGEQCLHLKVNKDACINIGALANGAYQAQLTDDKGKLLGSKKVLILR